MKIHKTVSLSIETAMKLSNEPNASKLIEALLKNYWDTQTEEALKG